MELPGNYADISGLSDEEVLASSEAYGTNTLEFKKERGFIITLKSLFSEPMVVLLLAAALLYLLSGNRGDAAFMAIAIVFVAAISLYQDNRSRKALEKLKSLTQPSARVIRNYALKEIKTAEIVVGDCLVVEEGTAIAADGKILRANDFSVNESMLTGESMPVFKDAASEEPNIYQGTTVTTGLAIAQVTAIGLQTSLGKIGKSLESVKESRTPLETQISSFVKKMVLAGSVVFLVVWAIHFVNTHQWLDSLLKALTLAMSVLPEEIPVAFTTFMALGAWRLMKKGLVVKQMKTVETLGSATVICTDKTGTITENKMTLAGVYVLAKNALAKSSQEWEAEEKELIATAMWASEPIPFDPMEKALHEAYAVLAKQDLRPKFKMAHEYPLSGKPPMMTHVFEDMRGTRIIAAKGAPEALVALCNLDNQMQDNLEKAMETFSNDGYRVLAVAKSSFSGNTFPETQQELAFELIGLVAFFDPPKKNIQSVFRKFYEAGIRVIAITGDNARTTQSILRQVDFKGANLCMDGREIMELSEEELEQRTREVQVFTRMFPEAKLRIVNALKANQEIVAMTGDGVNDGPALKAAHIGIAMGKKGTEIARQSASLILTNDDLEGMVDAIAMGRKIYANLKKAIQYIISIHIPIILTVFLPLVFGWAYPSIFTPVHIIFLELIMGPTCSIVFENEPMEEHIMQQKPRQASKTFFNFRELMISVIQGLMITAGTLFAYQYGVQNGFDESLTRTMVFTTLIAANIFLTFVNRSFYHSILTTFRYRNNLIWLIVAITVLLTSTMLFFEPLARFFQFAPINAGLVGISILIGFVSVIWMEGYKAARRYYFPRLTHSAQ